MNNADLTILTPGTSPLKAIEKLPSVNFQSADPFGNYEWSTRVTIRGFNQNQLGFNLDGIPLGDMSYGNNNGLHISRAIAPENIAVNRLADASGRPTGIELGTAGITSPGDFVESGFDRATAAKLDAAFSEHNPEVLWTDNLHQGYVRLELTRAVGRATFVGVDNIATRRYRTFPISQWQVVRGAEGLDLKRRS